MSLVAVVACRSLHCCQEVQYLARIKARDHLVRAERPRAVEEISGHIVAASGIKEPLRAANACRNESCGL
jgi:hypothetical protein